MSSPISSGINFSELNVSFVLPSTIMPPSPSHNFPMVEQLVLEIVEKVLVDQAVEEDLEPLLCNWDTNYNWGVPAVPVPLLPSAPDFSIGEWLMSGSQPPVQAQPETYQCPMLSGSQSLVEEKKRPKIYQCHMAVCLVLGRGCADYLYNLVKHFNKFHPEIDKNSPFYPKQANFVRFLVVQDSPSSTPPLCISPEVRFKSFIITDGSE